jgi:hypothetical protein
MSNHLTITRFGLLVSDLPSLYAPRLSGNELLTAFREQAETLSALLLSNRPESKPKSVQIVGVLPEAVDQSSSRNRDGPDAFETLIALLPRQKFEFSLNEVDWRVSTRVSITSCSLHKEPGRSKLWYSIEALPSTKMGTDDEPALLGFLDDISKREETALSGLKQAYKDSLKHMGKFAGQLEFDDKPIRITLTDDDTRPVARILDALYFDGMKSAQLRDTDDELRHGFTKFEHLVSHVAPEHRETFGNNLFVESASPAIKGLLCEYENTSRYRSLVAGFARNAGDGGGYQDVLDKFDGAAPKDASVLLDYMRARSAARRLSAKLADREARRLEGRKLEGRPTALRL